MKKIDLNDIDKQAKIDALDSFRDGISRDLENGKVSAVLLMLINRVNELTDLVLLMRDRKKPGPKPTTKRKSKKKGGEIDK